MFDTNNEKSIRKGLSRGESRLLSSLAEKRKDIFSLNDVILELNCPYENAKVIANRLARKKWIIPLGRGKYLLVPLSAGVEGKYTEHEFVIASKLVSPYYIGYWSALNYYGFTEQTPFTVFIATTKRLKSRKILDIGYRFVTLSKRKFFGFTGIAIANSTVNISDKEKTIADSLDHPEYCGGISEVAKCLWNARDEISPGKLVDVALKMGNTSILKRFGYLSEILEIRLSEDVTSRITSSLGRGFSPLDPMAGKRGKYCTKWNLLVNVPIESLLEWRGSY
jgi:predicted transcriptional regulator of viral defense system